VALEPGAEMFGWDVLALGLPAADAPFAAADTALLDGPCGWAGHRALGTLWFAAGSPLADDRREQLLEAARQIAGDHPQAATAGATAPQLDVVTLRVLAPRVEPVLDLLTRTWRAWRTLAWARDACAPRVWRT